MCETIRNRFKPKFIIMSGLRLFLKISAEGRRDELGSYCLKFYYLVRNLVWDIIFMSAVMPGAVGSVLLFRC